MKKSLILLLALLSAALLCACTKSAEKKSEASQPVEAFYNAIVTQNRDRIGSIACSAWEKDALREVDAFMGVKSELKDFSCSVTEEGKENAVVTCSGSIAASYGAEVTEFPLNGRTHKVVKEQGEWRICGY